MIFPVSISDNKWIMDKKRKLLLVFHQCRIPCKTRVCRTLKLPLKTQVQSITMYMSFKCLQNSKSPKWRPTPDVTLVQTRLGMTQICYFIPYSLSWSNLYITRNYSLTFLYANVCLRKEIQRRICYYYMMFLINGDYFHSNMLLKFEANLGDNV